jgi:hypothetical protein
MGSRLNRGRQFGGGRDRRGGGRVTRKSWSGEKEDYRRGTEAARKVTTAPSRDKGVLYLLSVAATTCIINAKSLIDDTSSTSWIQQSRESFFTRAGASALLLMTKFGKTGKIGPSDFLFRTI